MGNAQRRAGVFTFSPAPPTFPSAISPQEYRDPNSKDVFVEKSGWSNFWSNVLEMVDVRDVAVDLSRPLATGDPSRTKRRKELQLSARAAAAAAAGAAGTAGAAGAAAAADALEEDEDGDELDHDDADDAVGDRAVAQDNNLLATAVRSDDVELNVIGGPLAPAPGPLR